MGERVSRDAERGGGVNSGAFVVMVPVLLLFICGAIQVGLWYHARQTVTAAAQAAAAAQSVALAAAGAGDAAASQVIRQGGISGSTVSVAVGADTVTVTVTGRISQIIPMGLHPVSATVTVPREHMS